MNRRTIDEIWRNVLKIQVAKLLVARYALPSSKDLNRGWPTCETQSHTGLEHALLSMGLTRDVLPTNAHSWSLGLILQWLTAPNTTEWRSNQIGQTTPPSSPRTSDEHCCCENLATSVTSTSSITDLTCFEGETVAVIGSNPLLAANRWIVLMADYASPFCRRAIRTWWCGKGKCAGSYGVSIDKKLVLGIDWLSRFWLDIPVRIATLPGDTFVWSKECTDRFAQAKVLPNVRQTLEKFDTIKRILG